MIKKILLFLLALAAVYGAVLSPYSLSNTFDTKSRLESAIAQQASAKSARDTAKQSLDSAKVAFESERTFGLHYTDLASIRTILDNVVGVSFVNLYEADVNANYAQGQIIDIDSLAAINENGEAVPFTLPPALMLTIMAENTADGLRILDRFEMPIHHINTSEPGRIEVIFLTGGES